MSKKIRQVVKELIEECFYWKTWGELLRALVVTDLSPDRPSSHPSAGVKSA